jgi:selenocysteine lyase/cysteine desulfurase
MVTRRDSLTAFAAASLAGLASGASAQSRREPAPLPPQVTPAPRDNFKITGTFINAAYTHPLPLDAAVAAREYLAGRCDPGLRGGRRRDANALFAQLINAKPSEIAGIPSTSYGESFVAGALGLFEDTKAKIVSDILHFDGALYMYGELAKRGNPFTILPMTKDGRIDMNALEKAVTPGTKLVAVSAVSMVNGFQHDLKTVCEIAHRRGAHVFVDAIQGAGAVPIDVKATGVDFLACSSFKWLQGDFGYGFLYAREDLLPILRRAQYGYHQPKTLAYHALPGDPPGKALFEATPNNASAAGYFEVGSMGTAAEVAVAVSLQNLLNTGVANIQKTRQPLMDKMYEKLGAKYEPLTPKGSTSSIMAWSLPDANTVLGAKIREAGINIQLYKTRFRVSPSIYNTMDDIDKLIGVLT